MQYLYTLTSSSNDNYYEQFLLSVTSLKQAMPNVKVVLLCDSKTKETLTGKRSGYEKYISDIIQVNIPSSFSQVEISRWVKTSMRNLVQGDFLFIDCDTIIAEDLSSIAETQIKFGACLDKHSLIENHSKKDIIKEQDKQLNFYSSSSNRHYNSGVIYCKDTPEIKKIFERWHELWLFSSIKNIKRDQPSFNMAIYEHFDQFTDLDGTWNCQIAYNGLPYLANSKIIHYFASDLVLNTSPFLPGSDNIFKKIKDSGKIPNEVMQLLQNPRSAFIAESRIVCGADMLNVINSGLFEFIFFLQKKMPYFFKFLNRLSKIFKKLIKKNFIKSSLKKDSGIKFYN